MVNTGIADVTDHIPISHKQDAGKGGPYSFDSVVFTIFKDPRVQFLKKKRPFGADDLHINVFKFIREFFIEPLRECPDHRRACQLALGKTAHTITNHRKQDLFALYPCVLYKDTVLVCIFRNTDIGIRRSYKPHLIIHSLSAFTR